MAVVQLNSDTPVGGAAPLSVPAGRRCRGGADATGEAGRQATVGLLQKAFTLLDALGCGEVLGASEMARRTGIPKSSAHRVLSMLEGIGAVERQRNGYVSHRHARAGVRPPAGGTAEIRERILPALLEVYERTHETVQFGMLAGTEVLCVERLPGRRAVRLPGRVGGTLPSHCTALGKALLAFTRAASVGTGGAMRAFTPATVTNRAQLQLELARVARGGIAFDRGEFVAGVLCVAAPVLGPDRRPVGAISISAVPERARFGSLVDAVRRAADVASMSLRPRPVPEIPANRSA